MTEKAIKRKQKVVQWCVKEIDSFPFKELNDGTLSAEAMRARLRMMTSVVMVPDVNGVHFLDDDTNWQILQREMKIYSSMFYDRANLVGRAWGNIIGGPDPSDNRLSMADAFYRVKIDGGRYRPERVATFPEFVDTTLNDVRAEWGISGAVPEISSDSSIRSLFLLIGGNRYEVTVVPNQVEYRHIQGSAGTVGLEVVANDPLSKVMVTPPVHFNGVQPVEIDITIMAEDDSVTVYKFIVVPDLTLAEREANATLTTLEVLADGVVLPFTAPFTPLTFNYILEVPDGTRSVSYNVVLGYSDATVTLPPTVVQVGLIIKAFTVTSADGNNQNQYGVLFVRNA